MTETATQRNANEARRNYTKRVPISACKLRTGDRERLFRLINEKQIEERDRVLSFLYKLDNETEGEFQERRKKVLDAFVTTVRIQGFDNEVVTGHGESFFNSGLLPERILSIEYDTAFSPKAVLDFTPNNRASVLLDFSHPRIFDRWQPSEPTPNNSNWFVTADGEAWSTSLSTRLQQFFEERRTHMDWLHRSNTYDLLLMVMGFPLGLWGAYRIGHPAAVYLRPPSDIETALYVYAFFLSLNVFRWMFSYARWVFPKVEADEARSAPGKHRAVFGALVLGIVGSALWDAIKALSA